MADKTETKEVKPEEKKTEETEETEQTEDKKEQSIYVRPYRTEIILRRRRYSRQRKDLFYDILRNSLRYNESVKLKAIGNDVSSACILVERLKRAKLAKVKAVKTGMNLDVNFVGRRAFWQEPEAMIQFDLVRGELSTCVSGYQQRQVINIFESNDSAKKTGKLSLDELNKLNLPKAFKANEEQIKDADDFLSKSKLKELDLSNFIKYASLLIHPLLRNLVFTKILEEEFNLKGDDKAGDADDADAADDDDDTQNVD